MLPTKQNLPSNQRALLKLFVSLSESDQATLTAFAQFLHSRSQDSHSPKPKSPPKPNPVPRPETESVVGAIKRLSKVYCMLDRSDLLTETSSLMTAHIMHGRNAKGVIDDLEVLFEQHYQKMVSTYE
ncbi:MAG: hypothetical protein GY703_17925 [Gammaproteobacteria bacterium]|nr:hypothetical protein [Gammaproteobacteria bacterium]